MYKTTEVVPIRYQIVATDVAGTSVATILAMWNGNIHNFLERESQQAAGFQCRVIV